MLLTILGLVLLVVVNVPSVVAQTNNIQANCARPNLQGLPCNNTNKYGCLKGTPATIPAAMPDNFTIAMIGDQGMTNEAKAVLNLMKQENVDLVLHAGDLSYTGPETMNAWLAQISTYYGNGSYLAAMGNHDNGEAPPG